MTASPAHNPSLDGCCCKFLHFQAPQNEDGVLKLTAAHICLQIAGRWRSPAHQRQAAQTRGPCCLDRHETHVQDARDIVRVKPCEAQSTMNNLKTETLFSRRLGLAPAKSLGPVRWLASLLTLRRPRVPFATMQKARSR